MSTHQKNDFSSEEDKITNISSARKLLVVAVVAAIIFGIIYWALKDDDTIESVGEEAAIEEPQFEREGVLYFTNQDAGDTLSRIAIEVSRSEAEHEQGLMYRSQMADSLGMLFIYENAKPRSFWMKNTKLSLDILYVNENKEVVMIYKGVVPFSQKPVPSYKNAQYVVEVNAGYTTAHNIKEGDHIAFSLMNN